MKNIIKFPLNTIQNYTCELNEIIQKGQRNK